MYHLVFVLEKKSIFLLEVVTQKHVVSSTTKAWAELQLPEYAYLS
jgi:hypothetical protein